jgi:hypothetical protein
MASVQARTLLLKAGRYAKLELHEAGGENRPVQAKTIVDDMHGG